MYVDYSDPLGKAEQKKNHGMEPAICIVLLRMSTDDYCH